MALECQEVENSSLKNYVDCSPWEEYVSPPDFRSFGTCSILRSNSIEEAQTKPSVANSKSLIQSRKGIAKSDISGGDHSSSNWHRSITDLPPALVSEILHCLDAKELGIISCVSIFLNNVASDHQGWKEFYCERWGPPLVLKGPSGLGIPDQRSWKELFIEREFRSKVFMGRFSVDVLHGHTEAVRAVFLLPCANLIFTGGYDSIVRMWDMEEGLSICSSQPLGCTIRAITADNELLVAAGTGCFLQCWRAIEGQSQLFDITGSISNQNSEIRLWGHEGPVTCLALDSSRIYSGSWDMSIRLWDRSQLKCVKVLRHFDWVWSLVPRGSTVASTAGRDAYIWDIKSGDQMIVIQSAHIGNSHALARSHSGDLLFTGGEDGAIHMFEAPSHSNGEDIKPVATWIPHTGAVNSLAFEFPWLVSSSSDGRLALIDVRKLLKSSRCSSSRNKTRVCRSSLVSVEPPQRMLHGYGCNLFSVDIGADRIVCGGEEGIVRVWNFSQALEIEKRVRALRGIRLENRMRRRKVQIEMSSRNEVADQCSVAAKRNQMNGKRNGIWHSKRIMSGKLKA